MVSDLQAIKASPAKPVWLWRNLSASWPSLRLLASWKDRKPLAQALKPVYQADDADAAQQALRAFEDGECGFGTGSFRFSLSPRPCGKSCTPQMRLRACTAASARASETKGTFPAARPR